MYQKLAHAFSLNIHTNLYFYENVLSSLKSVKWFWLGSIPKKYSLTCCRLPFKCCPRDIKTINCTVLSKICYNYWSSSRGWAALERNGVWRNTFLLIAAQLQHVTNIYRSYIETPILMRCCAPQNPILRLRRQIEPTVICSPNPNFRVNGEINWCTNNTSEDNINTFVSSFICQESKEGRDFMDTLCTFLTKNLHFLMINLLLCIIKLRFNPFTKQGYHA